MARELSTSEMARRMALLMLYTAYINPHGKAACAKGAFGPEIDGLLASGYAEPAHGGWMMTEAGARHWEVDITKVASAWEEMDDAQIDILTALSASPDGAWIKRQDLPGYRPHDTRLRSPCALLCKLGLIERQKNNSHRIFYRITPKGINCLKRVGKTGAAV